MDIEKLRSFITAANLGSISSAADELFLTASAVSKQIAALESAFGVPLFIRKAKQLVLTDAGALCLESARQIVEEYDRLFSKLAQSSALTVLCVPFQSLVVPLLSDFEKRCPGMRIRIKDMHGPKIAEAIEHGEYELGFAGTVYSNSAALEQLVFNNTPVHVLVPEGHRLAGRKSVSLKELKGENFCLMAPETGLYQDYIELCRKNGFIPNVVYTSPREDTLIAHVASGGAITFFSECETNYHSLEGTVFVPLEERYETGFALIRQRGTELSPAAQALWEHVKSLEL